MKLTSKMEKLIEQVEAGGDDVGVHERELGKLVAEQARAITELLGGAAALVDDIATEKHNSGEYAEL